jgi:hypothetical protein
MKPFKTMAHINSLNGEMDEITVLQEHYMFGHKINNSYIVDYKGTKCTAIFNCFVGEYYADDKFGIVTAYEKY